MLIQFWKLEITSYPVVWLIFRGSIILGSCGMSKDIFPMIFMHLLVHRYQNYKVINLGGSQNEALIYHYYELKTVFQYLLPSQRFSSSKMVWKNHIFGPFSTSNSPRIMKLAPNDLKFGIQVYFYVLYKKK